MQLFVMNDNGSNPVRLTNIPDWNGFPSPSPDGKLIAFVSETRNAEGWPKDQAIFHPVRWLPSNQPAARRRPI
jgi:Tol biopolymer transport system component